MLKSLMIAVLTAAAITAAALLLTLAAFWLGTHTAIPPAR